jgi:hypothetical protein
MERGSEAFRIEGKKGVYCKECFEEPAIDIDLRHLDMLIARDVLAYPGVGYYRRKSCYSGGHEPCNKGDVTPDHPQWEASLYYKHPATNLFAVPSFATEMRDTWDLVKQLTAAYKFKLELDEQWVASFIGKEEIYTGEHWKPELAICFAALKTIGVVAG